MPGLKNKRGKNRVRAAVASKRYCAQQGEREKPQRKQLRERQM